jgi:hypothetical protein
MKMQKELFKRGTILLNVRDKRKEKKQEANR